MSMDKVDLPDSHVNNTTFISYGANHLKKFINVFQKIRLQIR